MLGIDGFIDEPRVDAGGNLYRGRLALNGVQWTGKAPDVFGTVTVTLEQVVDAAEGRILWTDQAVQRGIQPTAPSGTPRELALADGYPDDRYIFAARNADDITDKVLDGDRLFLSPLVWNLRPGSFEAYWDEPRKEFILYSGKVFLPDSHHRHQALLKAARAYRDHPKSYPLFDFSRQFKVELYFLSKADEGNYFFDKNQRPKPTALSKAFDLTTEDDLSTLAKRVLEYSPKLDAGVNRATDRLSKKAPHFMTLSTLRELMRIYAGSNEVDETELEGLARIAADFLEMLMQVRPELNVGTPNAVREGSLASSAVMILGYGALLKDFDADLARLGSEEARKTWGVRLDRLDPGQTYGRGTWRGDFLSKSNPLWEEVGITRRNAKSGQLTTLNTGGARAQAGRALREFVSA